MLNHISNCHNADQQNLKSGLNLFNQYQYRQKYPNIPISFKGMIIMQIWKKLKLRNYQNDLQSKQNDSSLNHKKKLAKRYNFFQWYFKVFRHKIVNNVINKVLSQQTASSGSVFYRLKILIQQQKKNKKLIEHQQRTQKAVQQPKIINVLDFQAKKISPVENPKLMPQTARQQMKNQQQKEMMRTKSYSKKIQNIENQMAKDLKKLDSLIEKVDEIQKKQGLISNLLN